MLASKVLDIFRNISNEDCETLGLSPEHSRPEWMVCSALQLHIFIIKSMHLQQLYFLAMPLFLRYLFPFLVTHSRPLRFLRDSPFHHWLYAPVSR